MTRRDNKTLAFVSEFKAKHTISVAFEGVLTLVNINGFDLPCGFVWYLTDINSLTQFN